MNKNIKINKKEIKWTVWRNKGINIIHDIIHSDGSFLSIPEIQVIYGIKVNFLDYNSLKDAIPKQWREKLKTMKVERNAISSDEPACIIINKISVPVQAITNKTIYWELIGKIRVTPIIKDKWIQLFNLNTETWEGIFEIAKVIRDTKIRTFQYKLLFNILPCNLYLFRIGRRTSYKCHYCEKTDNITHYFYECKGTRNFWSSFNNWWNNMNNENMTITMEIALLGVVNQGLGADKINVCLQLARWYIYTEKLNIKDTFFYRSFCLLKYKINLEKTICQKNNQMGKFKRIWQEIEEYLE